MESAHPVLRAFNHFLPLSIASETIGNLTLKEWPLYHPIILRGLILTIVWLIVFAVPVCFFGSLKKDIGLRSQ